MFESLSNMFGAGGKLATGNGIYSNGALEQMSGGTDPKMVEKGSILGMTPSTFASAAGQFGAALSPKGSWQQQLGGAAAQMGSQKIAQLAQAEKEKRMTELLKQMFGQAKVGDLTKTIDPNHPLGTAIGSDSAMSMGMYGKDLSRNSNFA